MVVVVMSGTEGLMLAPIELRRKRDFEQALLALPYDGEPAMVSMGRRLAEFLELDLPQVHSFEEHGGSIRTAFLYTDILGDLLGSMDAAIRETGAVGFSAFHLLAPERSQQNRAVTFTPAQIRPVNQAPYGAAQVLDRHGLGNVHHLRVLICEGSGLLAWVGGFRGDAFRARDRQRLQSIVPALRRRLLLERQLETAAQTRRALEATLELLGRPAYVVTGTRARVLHANRAGWQRLLLDRSALTNRLLTAAAGTDPAFEAHQISKQGAPLEVLVIEREESQVVARTRLAAVRWTLSPRQTEVLQLVARGLSNAAIAADLRISIRTVEVHVTALFDRAGCESRASLIALLWA